MCVSILESWARWCANSRSRDSSPKGRQRSRSGLLGSGHQRPARCLGGQSDTSRRTFTNLGRSGNVPQSPRGPERNRRGDHRRPAEEADEVARPDGCQPGLRRVEAAHEERARSAGTVHLFWKGVMRRLLGVTAGPKAAAPACLPVPGSVSALIGLHLHALPQFHRVPESRSHRQRGKSPNPERQSRTGVR